MDDRTESWKLDNEQALMWFVGRYPKVQKVQLGPQLYFRNPRCPFEAPSQ